MKAIPKSLLSHQASVYRETETGQWGGGNLELMGNLVRIRIEPSSRVVRDKNDREMQLSAVLFVDCKNSLNTAGTLEEDLILDFQGTRYRIVSVEPLYDEKRLHHYEIGMVRYAG